VGGNLVGGGPPGADGGMGGVNGGAGPGMARRALGLATLAAVVGYGVSEYGPWFAPIGWVPQPAWSGEPVRHAPRHLPPRARGDVAGPAGWTLRPLADLSQRGRVLGTRRYRFDALASLSPIDVAMGWGAASDPAVLRRIAVWQSGRFWLGRHGPDLPRAVWSSFLASIKNVHCVPADAAARRALFALRPNGVARLEGSLVEARRGGTVVASSLRYDDTGAGSCQLFLVRALAVEA